MTAGPRYLTNSMDTGHIKTRVSSLKIRHYRHVICWITLL